MNYSNESNPIDDHYEHDSTRVSHIDINKNEIQDYLYDVIEIIDQSENRNDEDIFHMYKISKSINNSNDSEYVNLITDSGDIINYPDNNYENFRLLTTTDSLLPPNQFDDELIEPYPIPENSLIINKSQHSSFDNDETAIKAIVSIDEQSEDQLQSKQDINPYESSSLQLLTHSKSEENQLIVSTDSLIYNIEYCTDPICLALPQVIEIQIKTCNSFQQLWSSQVYSTQLIDSNKPESTLSMLWLLIILIWKLFINGLHVFVSCVKFLRYDAALFTFCYLLGAAFAMNIDCLIDFLLITTCIICIFMIIYEKWLFRYVDLNEYDHVNNESQYWKRIKLAAYGLVSGTMTTYII